MKIKLHVKHLPVVMAFCALVFSGCSKDDDSATPADQNPTGNATGTWSGKLVHDWSSSIREYDFATKADPELFDGRMPNRMPNGNTLHIGGTFERLEMTTPNGAQKTVIYDAKETTAIYSPQLSPDGTKIAFTHRKIYDPSAYPVKEGTVIIDLQGNYVAGIPNKYQASWLPDGRLVVAGDFSSDGYISGTPNTNSGLYIATLTGTTATLTNINPAINNPKPFHPAASPDGKQVAFILNKHVWKVNLDGSNLKQITAADNDNDETYPAWSPDGKYLASWSYKTFENTFYTAIAIVPSEPAQPVILKNDAEIWPRDQNGKRISGGRGNMSWK